VRWAALLLLLAGCASRPEGAPAATSFAGIPTEAVGAGSILRQLPEGERGPSDKAGNPVQPRLAEGWQGPPPTNDWWSSLLWPYDPQRPFGQPLYAHPLALQAEAAGLGVGYPTRPVIDERSYFYPFQRDLRLGVQGLAARDARAASASDWVVTALVAGEGRALRATFGHGLPYVYCEAQGGPAEIELPEGARTWSEGRSTLGVTVDGHSYGLFLPAGAWIRQGRRLTASGGPGPFSVAVLPEETPAALALFRRHAFAFVTDSRVSWRYDEATATVATTFTLTTAVKDGGADPGPLQALYPHQWLNSAAGAGPLSYLSPRGAMKLLAARSFETRLRFGGVLPVLPPSGGPAPRTVKSQIEAAYKGGVLFPIGPEGTRGTYWTGKALQKLSLLAWLAEQIGEASTRQDLVRAVEGELERWFDGKAPEAFAYQPAWHTLVGVPQEYRSGWELNDHHFHYGYYVFAAATVARFDPSWAQRFAPMVDLLISDAANGDRADQRFPFLRHFDPFAGHSWASGPALFREGNNEESSSEDMNFATATALWGALTGDRQRRDLGIFLHAQTAAAIEQYWFDVDHRVFPRGFDKPAVAMVWGSGGRYDTWWDHNPIYVHAINFLPFTGGSLYLGRHPDYVRENHRRLLAANHGEVRLWRDLIWMYQALADPAAAAALYDANHYFDPEAGDSLAFAYHWIQSLRALGQVDATVTADVPTYAVFRRGNVRTHAALNPGAERRRVTFSDGASLEVAPGTMQTVETDVAVVSRK
jgi:endoglucanase Acf2